MTSTHDIPVLDAKGLRHFAWVTASVVAALFGLILPLALGFDMPRWPWLLAAGLALWGLVSPRSLGPVYRTWMRFGMLMSRIMTPLVLGLVFVLVFTPIAILMALIRRDPMARSLDATARSYRIVRDKPPREKMERPY